MNPLLDSQEKLASLVGLLEGETEIAVDTEADSLHCYFEKLCLIQISTEGGKHFLVDPLAGLSLQPLLDVFERKTLIFHAAEYDLRMLRTAGDFRPARIFDTGLAARLLGARELGLATITQSLLGVTLLKNSQKENWALRPLPQKMVDYAINDTRHLHTLKRCLEARLVEKGRLSWLQESCERLVTGALQVKPRDEESAWKISGHAKLSPRAAAILRELWLWRDALAREKDKPAFHILRNEDLLRAAEAFDKGEEFDSRQLRGEARRTFFARGRDAASLPPDKWPRREQRPRRKKFTEEQEARLEHLRRIRDAQARALELDASVIAPRAVMERVAADPAHARTSLMRWQRELLGLEEAAVATQV